MLNQAGTGQSPAFVINSPGFSPDMLATSHFVSSANIKTMLLHNAAITANAIQSINFMGLSRSKRVLEDSFIVI